MFSPPCFKCFQTKDQLTNMKAMQWVLSSSFNTFQATALSYEIGLPMLDTHTPPWRHVKPCQYKSNERQTRHSVDAELNHEQKSFTSKRSHHWLKRRPNVNIVNKKILKTSYLVWFVVHLTLTIFLSGHFTQDCFFWETINANSSCKGNGAIKKN